MKISVVCKNCIRSIYGRFNCSYHKINHSYRQIIIPVPWILWELRTEVGWWLPFNLQFIWTTLPWRGPGMLFCFGCGRLEKFLMLRNPCEHYYVFRFFISEIILSTSWNAMQDARSIRKIPTRSPGLAPSCLNSHGFSYGRDGHPICSMGLYTHYKDSPFKVGWPFPNMGVPTGGYFEIKISAVRFQPLSWCEAQSLRIKSHKAGSSPYSPPKSKFRILLAGSMRVGSILGGSNLMLKSKVHLRDFPDSGCIVWVGSTMIPGMAFQPWL